MIENDIPILLIAFNRVEITQNAIEHLREIKPSKFFFSVDGPRKNNSNDKDLILKVKNLVELIDWPCHIETLFSEINFGSGIWPYTSIQWALSRSPKLIIIEDDVRISSTFYQISRSCLNTYEANKDIFAICASNIVDNTGLEKSQIIRASKYFSGWGWATWANRWNDYKLNLNEVKKINLYSLLKKNNFNFFVWIYFWMNFYKIRKDKIKAWDYQINHLLFSSSKIILKPDRNLSTNVGIGESATHTNKMPILKINNLDFNTINFVTNLQVDRLKEKKWRKARMKFLLKTLMLKIKVI